ncbi:hypothetical protein V7T16_12825 [Vibrio metoecus]|uniref:hypothetical protein n=1 Tax=Vibrio metoecus TaxID=1481663 RepID=UPI00300DB4AB
MRLSPIRIFWISIISMFAMLNSSIASSAPLMALQMISASSHQSEVPSGCVMVDSNQLSHSMPMDNSSMQENSSHCMSDAPSIHNCCTAACVSVFAFLPQTAYNLPAQYQLALIAYESAKSVVQRQQSLYRPPIA